MPINLNVYELEALKDALQLLSQKEQKVVENYHQVSLPSLYNKIVSCSEQFQ
jgi:hypothetical protein